MKTDEVEYELACQNTDIVLYKTEVLDGKFQQSIHVTRDGRIGINIDGFVIEKPLSKWHELGVKSGNATNIKISSLGELR